MLASRRLQVPPAFAVPRLDGVGDLLAVTGHPEERRSALHDTEELDLTRWGARIEHDPAFGWRLELPPVGEVAGAVHHVPGGPTVPAALADTLYALTGDRPLRRLVRLDIRAEVTLLLAQGQEEPVVALADEEVSVTEGRRLLARFRELVLRPGTGATTARLDALADALVAAGATPLAGGTSRLTEVFGQRAAAPPAVPLGTVERRDEPLPGRIAARLRTRIHHLLLLVPHLRAAAAPTAVASWEATLRGLVAELCLWEPWLTPATRELRADLGGLLAASEPLRALDRSVAGVVAAAARLDVSDHQRELVRSLGDERERLRGGFVATLAGETSRSLLGRLRAVGLEPPVVEDAEAVEVAIHVRRAARELWGQLAADVDAVGVATLSARRRDLLEQLAILTELGRDVDGKPARRFEKQLRRYRRALTQIVDRRATVTWLHGVGAGRSPADAFLAGRLAGAEEVALRDARGRAATAWERWSAPKAQRWIGDGT